MSNSTERKDVKGFKYSISSQIFLISVNIFLFYLLFDIKPLMYISFVGVGFSLLFSLFLNLQKRLNKTSKTDESLLPNINSIKLALKYFNINKKYIIVSVIGLVFATSIISQAFIISQNYQKSSVNNFLANSDNTAFNININGSEKKNATDRLLNTLGPKIESIIKSHNFKLNNISKLVTYNLWTKTGNRIYNGLPPFANTWVLPTLETNINYWSEALFNKVHLIPSLSNSSWTYNPNERLFTIFEPNNIDLRNIYNNKTGTVQFLIGNQFISPGADFSLFPYNITKAVKLNSTDINYLLNTHQDNLISELTNTIFMNNKTVWDLYYSILLNSTNYIQKGDTLHPPLLDIEAHVYMILPNLLNTNLQQWIVDLNQVKYELKTWISEHIDGLVSIGTPLFDNLVYYVNNQQSNILILLILASGPLIGLALYLAYFSLSLVEQRKRRIIEIMKIRGTSNSQLRVVLTSEIITNALIAIIVGLIASIPIAGLILQDAGILTFKIQFLNKFIPESWYWKLPLVALILAFDLNISQILSFSREDLEQIGNAEEKVPPFWQRIYLDIVLFSISAIYWFIIYYVPLGSSRGPLIKSLGPIMAVIFLIGAPLLSARYFSSVFSKISDFFWRFSGGIFAFATRNMRTNKFSSSKLVAFLVMGLILSVISTTLPVTFNSWSHEKFYYNLGADIYVSNIDTSNSTIMNYLNVTGVQAYTPIEKLSLETINFKFTMLGINSSTFANAAFWQNDYAKESINAIAKSVKSNYSIGLQAQELKGTGLTVGKTIEITYKRNIIFNITNEFNLFPNLVNSIPVTDTNQNVQVTQLHILTSINTIKLMDALSSDIVTGAYVKVKPNYSIDKVASELQANLTQFRNVEVKPITTASFDFIENNAASLIFRTLQNMLVVTFLSSIIAVAYFSFLSMSERRKEIGLLKALGMVRRQISFLLVTESLLILITAGIIGIFVGIFMSTNFFLMITQVFSTGDIPKFKLIIPWDTIWNFSLILGIFTAVAAFIPAQINARKQTGLILRSE